MKVNPLDPPTENIVAILLVVFLTIVWLFCLKMDPELYFLTIEASVLPASLDLVEDEEQVK